VNDAAGPSGLGGDVEVRVAHTARLEPGLLASARSLLDDAFAGHEDGDFDDDDWEHSLGGTHALVTRGGDSPELLAHGSLVQRRLVHWPTDGSGPRVLRCGYVEAVAVRADVRRMRLGWAVMQALEALLPAYHLGALGAGPGVAPFYAGRGWLPWRGRTYGLAPHGLVRTADDDDALMVLPVPGVPEPDLDGDLACDWREGDVW
jgi:aminoglycoside 2'-N-acetyltransferase I